MKAQNLTISLPNKGCDKKCPYCISKMTGFTQSDENLFSANIDKVKTIAKAAQVASVLITGKGEPFLNLDYLDYVCVEFSDYPIEVQTNGIVLKQAFYEESNSIYGLLENSTINVLAFSVDCIEYWKTLGELFHLLKQLGIIVRVTVNVTDQLGTDSFNELVAVANQTETTQLSLRNILEPDTKCGSSACEQVTTWIRDHNCSESYVNILKQFYEREEKYPLIRTLPFGAKVFDLQGIAFTHFDCCIQENNSTEDIRSLIYQEDGHLYTSWDSPASILF